MKRTTATVVGFLVAPALPALFFALMAPLSGSRNLWSVFGTFMLFYYFAATTAIILGIPTFLILTKIKLIRWWSALGSGACAGAIAHITLINGIELAPLLRFALFGGVSGFVIWLFWRTGRTEGLPPPT